MVIRIGARLISAENHFEQKLFEEMTLSAANRVADSQPSEISNPHDNNSMGYRHGNEMLVHKLPNPVPKAS